MGQVYLAEDTRLRRKVAIKFLPAGSVGNELAEKRLLREAQTAATLDHPNICSIYEVGEEGDLRFIVLQYVEGETLSARLKGGALDLPSTLAIAGQIADALAEAHRRGVIHRDIKPENVMITPRGQVKVLDFGLAKIVHDGVLDHSEAETESSLSMPGLIMGTLPYMSPEQVRGEELDSRSDIFSFGTVLYELINGSRAFDSKNRATLISSILTQDPAAFQSPPESRSSELELLVRKCMKRDPTLRYQTMVDLIADLQQIPHTSKIEIPTAARSEAIMASDPSAKRWHGSLKAVLAAIAVLIALATTWSLVSHRNPTMAPAPDNKAQNSPAYDYYVRGEVKISTENRENNDGAIDLLRKAVTRDPGFAPAYAGLARAYGAKAFLFASDTERKRYMEDAEVAVQKALALNPNLAEAHYARGQILWSQSKGFPHELAIQSYKRALALDPNLDDAHQQLAGIYVHIGLFDKADSELQAALKLNPDNSMARFRIGALDLYRGDYESALAIFNGLPRELNPALLERAKVTALFEAGKMEEATAVVDDFLKTYPADQGGAVTSVKAMLLARAGKKTEAEEAIQRANEIGKDFGHFHHTAYNIASAYALLHEPEKAVQWLQTAADDGFPCYPLFVSDPNLNNLRKDPRFIEFMESLKKRWEHYKATL